MKNLFLILLTTFIASHSFSQSTQNIESWTNVDHWENTKLDFNRIIYGTISKENCLSDVKNIVGCLAVLNRAMELQHPGSQPLLTYTPGTGTHGDFTISFHKELAWSDYRQLITNEYLRVIKLFQDELKTQTLIVRFDAQSIISQFEKDYLNQANSAYNTGILFNEYLSLAYDPHTYIVPKTMNELASRPKVQKKGIGIIVKEVKYNNVDHYLVESIFKNSPAQKAGLQKGDLFLSIDEYPGVAGLGSFKMKSIPIRVEVLRDEETFETYITPDTFDMNNVETEVLTKGNTRYGYIKLRTFMDNTSCMEIKSAGMKFKKEGVKGVILDLRGNGGGRVNQGMCISGLFQEKKSIVWSEKDINPDNNTIEVEYNKENPIFNDLHNVVLVDGYSASASELVAVNLQDYRKAFIVGETSFGKGSMQRLYKFDENDKVDFAKTIALFYGPKGVSPQIKGVVPDFEVYPVVEQTEPTKFRREKDLYSFVLEDSKANLDLTSERRLVDREVITNCLKEEETSQRYENLSQYQKWIFDNQIETSLDVIDCANKRVPIYKGIDIGYNPYYEHASLHNIEGQDKSFGGVIKSEIENNVDENLI